MRLEFDQPRLVPSLVTHPAQHHRKQLPAKPRPAISRCQSLRSHPVTRDSLTSISAAITEDGSIHRPRPRQAQPHARRGDSSSRYRPLELSIYLPNNRLSPLYPLLGAVDTRLAKVNGVSGPPWSSEPSTVHGSVIDKKWPSATQSSLATETPTGDGRVPRVPPPVRVRTDENSPAYQRLKSAIYERLELEEQLKSIEGTIHRKSICLSRSTSRRTLRETHGVSPGDESNGAL